MILTAVISYKHTQTSTNVHTLDYTTYRDHLSHPSIHLLPPHHTPACGKRACAIL